jgi:hypothetical protein
LGYADLKQNRKTDSRSAVVENCGISVMTNSASGLMPMSKIINAIAYLKGWPELTIDPGLGDPRVPFRAQGDLDSRWEDWAGEWSDGWILRKDSKGAPVAGVVEDVLLPLRPAAIAGVSYGEKSSVDLVLDGTQIMLRLGWEGEERIIDLWSGSLGFGGGASSKTLKRRSQVGDS